MRLPERRLVVPSAQIEGVVPASDIAGVGSNTSSYIVLNRAPAENAQLKEQNKKRANPFTEARTKKLVNRSTYVSTGFYARAEELSKVDFRVRERVRIGRRAAVFIPLEHDDRDYDYLEGVAQLFERAQFFKRSYAIRMYEMRERRIASMHEEVRERRYRQRSAFGEYLNRTYPDYVDFDSTVSPIRFWWMTMTDFEFHFWSIRPIIMKWSLYSFHAKELRSRKLVRVNMRYHRALKKAKKSRFSVLEGPDIIYVEHKPVVQAKLRQPPRPPPLHYRPIVDRQAMADIKNGESKTPHQLPRPNRRIKRLLKRMHTSELQGPERLSDFTTVMISFLNTIKRFGLEVFSPALASVYKTVIDAFSFSKIVLLIDALVDYANRTGEHIWDFFTDTISFMKSDKLYSGEIISIIASFMLKVVFGIAVHFSGIKSLTHFIITRAMPADLWALLTSIFASMGTWFGTKFAASMGFKPDERESIWIRVDRFISYGGSPPPADSHFGTSDPCPMQSTMDWNSMNEELRLMTRSTFEPKERERLGSYMNKMSEFLTRNNRMFSAVGAMPSFAIGITGSTGTGKTYLTEDLVRAMARSLNIPVETIVKNMQSGSCDPKFLNRSGTHDFCYHVDDNDAVKNPVDQPKTNGLPVIFSLTSGIYPFIPPSAELADKAKPYSAMCVMQTSNNDDLGVTNVFTPNSRAAYLRRFKVVMRVFVPPEYLKDGTIDPVKAAGNRLFQQFEVGRFVVTTHPKKVDSARFVPIKECEGGKRLNIDQMTAYVCRQFQEHVAEGVRKIQKAMEDLKKEACTCYNVHPGHPCGNSPDFIAPTPVPAAAYDVSNAFVDETRQITRPRGKRHEPKNKDTSTELQGPNQSTPVRFPMSYRFPKLSNLLPIHHFLNQKPYIRELILRFYPHFTDYSILDQCRIIIALACDHNSMAKIVMLNDYGSSKRSWVTRSLIDDVPDLSDSLEPADPFLTYLFDYGLFQPARCRETGHPYTLIGMLLYELPRRYRAHLRFFAYTNLSREVAQEMVIDSFATPDTTDSESLSDDDHIAVLQGPNQSTMNVQPVPVPDKPKRGLIARLTAPRKGRAKKPTALDFAKTAGSRFWKRTKEDPWRMYSNACESIGHAGIQCGIPEMSSLLPDWAVVDWVAEDFRLFKEFIIEHLDRIKLIMAIGTFAAAGFMIRKKLKGRKESEDEEEKPSTRVRSVELQGPRNDIIDYDNPKLYMSANWDQEQYCVREFDPKPVSEILLSSKMSGVTVDHFKKTILEHQIIVEHRGFRLRAFAIGGEYVLMNHHSAPPDMSWVRLTMSKAQAQVTYQLGHIPGQEKEIRVYRLFGLKNFSQITHFFALQPPDGTVKAYFKETFDLTYYDKSKRKLTYKGEDRGEAQGFFDMHVNSDSGDCGLPVYVLEPAPAIIGIHFGGSTDKVKERGYNVASSEFVTKETLDLINTEVECAVGYSDYIDSTLVEVDILPPPTSHPNMNVAFRKGFPGIPMGKFPMGATPKSRMKPTSPAFHEYCAERLQELGTTYAPPALGTTIDAEGLETDAFHSLYNSPKAEPRVWDRRFALPATKIYCEWLFDRFPERPKFPNFATTFLDENGNIPCLEERVYISRVDITTSGGPGYGCKDKALAIEPRQFGPSAVRPLDPRLVPKAQRMLEGLKRRELIPMVAGLNAKDNEVRPPGKVARAIYGFPLPVYLLARLILAPLKYLMWKYPFVFECAVGINAMSPNWGLAANYLGWGPKLGGDVACHDGSIAKPNWEYPALAIKWIYDHFDLPFKDVVYYFIISLINACVCWRTVIYYMFHAHPSGFPLTAEINSLILSMMGFFALRRWENPSRHLHFGDDNTARLLYYLSPEAYIAKWARFGVTVTSAHKDRALEYEEFDTLTFLKRTFSQMTFADGKARWVAPIELTSIFKSGLYHVKPRPVIIRQSGMIAYRDMQDPNLVYGQIADAMLREAGAHGREFYEDLRKDLAIVAEVDKFPCTMTKNSFDDWQRMWLTKELTEMWRVRGDPNRVHDEMA